MEELEPAPVPAPRPPGEGVGVAAGAGEAEAYGEAGTPPAGTVAQLCAELRSRGLAQTGRKAELVVRLQQGPY